MLLVLRFYGWLRLGISFFPARGRVYFHDNGSSLTDPGYSFTRPTFNRTRGEEIGKRRCTSKRGENVPESIRYGD